MAANRPSLLERLTTAVLTGVLVTVTWITLVAYQPGWLRLPTVEIEVIFVLGLLVSALVLVSVVALKNTGSAPILWN